MTSKDDPNRIEKQAHRYAEYEAQDQKGESVGHVDDLFVDTVDGQEYVELNMGVLGLRSTIVPLEICTVDEEHKIVVIPQSRTKLRRAPRKRAPLLGDEVMAITPEYEDRIRKYFGLEPVGAATEERPFRAFSTAYPSGDEAPRGDVRPVEARILDRRSVEPETAQPPAVDEPEVTEPVTVEPRTVQPDVIEAQDAESVEPEVVGSQEEDAEAAGSEAAEPEADGPEIAQDVRIVEPRVIGSQDAAGPETAEPQQDTEPEPIDLAAAEDETVDVSVVKPEDAGTDVTLRVEEEVSEPDADAELRSDAEDLPGEAEAPVDDAPEADEQVNRPSGEETPQAAATARTSEVETAGQQMAEAGRQALQALADRAVTAQESNLDLSRSVAQTFVEQLQGQTQGNRQATQTLQQQGQRQQQAFQTIVQGSVSAYANLLTSTFSLYQQTLQTATRVAVGNFQAAARLAQRGVAIPAVVSQRGGEAAGQATQAATSQAEGQDSTAAEQEPSRQGAQVASPEGQPGDAGRATQDDMQQTAIRSDAEPTAREENVEATRSADASDGQDAGSGGETIAQGGTHEGGSDLAIDAAAPAGAPESANPLLPPPPVVPNILDELPPPPQVRPVDETSSEERE